MRKSAWTCLYCGKPLYAVWEDCGCEAVKKANKQCKHFIFVLLGVLSLVWLLGWLLT